MNRFYVLPVVLAGLLAGCNVVVQPNPITPPPPLEVLQASYSTNFSAPDGQPAICDNKATTITYTFRYQGQLESWTSYLKGQTLGKESGRQTFTPTSPYVSPYETSGYEVTYTLELNSAPYAMNQAVDPSELSPQGIIVTPKPTPPIGTTRLYLMLRGANDAAPPFVFSGDIPVYVNCS